MGVQIRRNLPVADALQQPVWTVRPDGSVDYANPFWLGYTGIRPDEALDEGWAAAVHPDDVAPIRDRWRRAAESGTAYEIEYRFRRADGVYRWHLARVGPIPGDEGGRHRWVGTAIDIHDRRAAEDALRASEARHRDIVENAGDIVYSLLPDGTVTAINPAVESLLGYRPEELIGRRIDTIVAPDHLVVTRGVLDRKLAGEDRSTYDLDVLTRDGRRVTLEINSRLAADADGRPAAIHGMARDVSDRRAAAAERRERYRQSELSAAIGAVLTARLPLEAQLQGCAQALVDHLDAALARVWTISDDEPSLLVLRASAGLYTHLDGGHARVPLGSWKIGRIGSERRPHLTNAVLGDSDVHDQAWAEREGMAAFAGYPLLVGDRLLGVMGLFARRPLSETTFTVLGSVSDAISVGIDRARSEAAREALLQAERTARERAEAAATTVATINRIGALLAAELDRDRLVQAVTEAATELTGARFGAFFYNVADGRGGSYTLYALAGAPRADFARFPMPANTAVFGPTFRGEGIVRVADIRDDPRYGKHPPHYGLPEGHLPVASYLAVPVVARSGEVLGGLFFGHPDPGIFDERAEALAVGLAAHAAVAIDNARLYRDAQAAEARYRGLFEGVADAILVADSERRYVDANVAALRLLGYTREELLGMRVDDIVAAGPAWTAEEYARYQLEGRWQGELELRRADGGLVPVEARATVVTLPTGAVFLSAVRDVSDRRAAERLQREFLEAVSHDLRNPLTAVHAQTQRMRRRIRRDGTVQPTDLDRMLATIEDGAERMSSQLDDLQDTASLRAGRPLALRSGTVDVAQVVRAAAAAAEAAAPGHRVSVDGVATLTGIADGTRLRRVLDNLLGNAVKFSPSGGTVRVTVNRDNRSDGAWAVVSVVDEGVGIPALDLPHVFEPGRRGTNVAGRIWGTGIGLAGARQIVEQHGGRIYAESEEGAGSTFSFSIPLAGPFVG